MISRPAIIYTCKHYETNPHICLLLLCLCDLTFFILFYYIVFKMQIIVIAMDFWNRETSEHQLTSVSHSVSELKTNAQEIDNQIELLIRKTRVFYLFFVFLNVVSVVLRFMIVFNPDFRARQILAAANTALLTLCFFMEVVVIRYFFVDSLKFAHIMQT